jgi:hypothetical protein
MSGFVQAVRGPVDHAARSGVAGRFTMSAGSAMAPMAPLAASFLPVGGARTQPISTPRPAASSTARRRLRQLQKPRARAARHAAITSTRERKRLYTLAHQTALKWHLEEPRQTRGHAF